MQLFTHSPKSRILITTQTNSAANVITKRLMSKSNEIKSQLRRLVSNSTIGKQNLPTELYEYSILVNRTNSTDFDMDFVPEAVKTCNVEGLEKFKIVISTCVATGVLYGSEYCNGFYSHVICDEASQIMEPEALIPISLVSSKFGRVIMAGDQLQLPPIVISDYAGDRGLRLSLFERLFNRYHEMENAILVNYFLEQIKFT